MRVPMVCVDPRLRQFASAFADAFSRPQFRHFVTVLVALLLCRGSRTLTGLLRTVQGGGRLASLSRFLSEAPWEATALAAAWRRRFDHQLTPHVARLHAEQRAARPKRRGRPTASIVTGYLIGDDSTCHKRRGRKMAGLGRHSSTTERRAVVGHNLVQALSVAAGRRCPLMPQLDRQKASCDAAKQPLHSNVDLMEAPIRNVVPLSDTCTHVLLDAWYGAKRIWKAARDRGFTITTGLRANRAIRVAETEADGGWRWGDRASSAAGLSAADDQAVVWPHQEGAGRTVWVHTVTAIVRNRSRAQVLIVRNTLDGPANEVRFWATSDVRATVAAAITHLAARWDIEALFADTKDLLGLDHYQMITTTAIVRFWTLALAAYVYLDEERARLRQERQRHVTIGDAQREVQCVHWAHLITWMQRQFRAGETTATLFRQLAA
mgnify:CR=1 FL=1